MKLTTKFKISNAGSHRHRDDNGYLFVDESPVLKAGVLEYYGSELIDGGSPEIDGVKVQPDKVYKVFVPAEELEKGAHTFSLLPITNDHQWLGADGADARDFQEGTTGETAVFKEDSIYVPLKFTGDKIIADIDDGEKEELSASYTNKLSKSDNPDYDFVASDIRGNHIALVEKGRCGPDVRVLNNKPESEMKLKNDAKLIIDGKEIDLGQFFAQEEKEPAHEDTGAITDTDNEESVDKRALIDEIGGILKDKVDEELWRTIIGKAEKLAYDGSEESKADNEDKREIIREIMAVAAKDDADFEGGEDEKIREVAKLAERLAYNPSEDSESDNECKEENEDKDADEEKDDDKGVKSENSAKAFNAAVTKAVNELKKQHADERAELKRAYNAASEVMGEFNPFGLTAHDMLVRALNHCGVDVEKESDAELYAMLKVCNATARVDNSFAYGADGSDEIEINVK